MFSNKIVYSGNLIFLVLMLAIFTRFIGLTWGDGLYFHPDENNMATSLAQLTSTNLNPNFFAYGQFPLYLGYLTLRVVGQPNTFANSIYILRFWSAIFSILSILIFYKITSKLFPQLIALFSLILFIFHPGLIQLAHFGTTESLLVFCLLASIYFSFNIFAKPAKLSWYLLSSLVIGVAIASKISALIFILPITLAVIRSIFGQSDKARIIKNFFIFILLTVVFALVLSPYNLIARNDFLSTLQYETGVATGKINVFYTNQYLHTIPYLFQLAKVFPYVSGLPQFMLSVASLILICFKFKKLHPDNRFYWALIIITASIYFIYFGGLYAKWTRFMSPIFFITPLLVVYLLSLIKARGLQVLLLIISCIPGIYFMNLYLHPDIRSTASSWFVQNIPPSAKVLSESGNVINFPVSAHGYNVTNFDFYNLDINPILPINLISQIYQSDYIVIPSRRIFKNQSIPEFPVSQNYYTNLFNGDLGYVEIKRYSPQTDLFLNPENAEETWSVFDRPTIRIFKKVRQLDYSQYEAMLNI